VQAFLARTAVTLGKRAGVVAVVGLGVTLVLGFGATKLEFATGQDSYLNTDEQVYKDNVAYQSLFGGQAMLTLFTMDEGVDVVGLFTPANIATLETEEEQLNATPGVLSVVSPLTALEFTQSLVTSPTGDPTQSPAGQILLRARDRDPDPASQAVRLADAAATLARLSAVPEAERTLENQEWVRFLLFDNAGSIRKSLRPFFPDEEHAQLVTRLEGNQDIEGEGAAAEAILAITDASVEHASVLTTGAPVLLKDINDYLKGGFLTLGAIAVVLMAIVLVLLFNVRWRLLSLGVVIIGLIWAFGLAGYLGIPLSVVTISGLPVLLGVGIDFAIQLHSRVEEEVVIDHEDHPMQRTWVGLVPALLVATAACVVSFLALELAQVPMLRAFGTLLAVGIVVVVAADIVLTSSALGWREYRSRTATGDYTRGALGNFVVKLGSLPRAAAPVLAVAAVVIFVAGALVEDSLELQTDPEEWVDQDSEVIQDLDTLREETGSSSELGIFVEADDVFTDEVASFVQGFANDQLARYPEELLTASSMVTTVGFLIEVPDTTYLPPLGIDVESAYDVAPPDIQTSTVSPDATALNLIFRTGPSSLAERAVVVNEISDSVDPPPGVTATPSGLAVVGVGLLENLEANRVLLTYVALGGVFLLLTLLLRSPVRALLCQVPVLIAVGASSLVAGAAGFELSPLTALGGPLVIAVCTEFTSLICMRFIEERKNGHDVQEAVDITASRTGRAFVCSGLAVIIGVGVLATSSLPLLRDFGIIVSMNVAVALLSALVVLPPILVWADGRGWVSGRSDAA
jgi:hydrophobe/amphiphile efflux-3 (HAE3) family protein